MVDLSFVELVKFLLSSHCLSTFLSTFNFFVLKCLDFRHVRVDLRGVEPLSKNQSPVLLRA